MLGAWLVGVEVAWKTDTVSKEIEGESGYGSWGARAERAPGIRLDKHFACS